MKKKNKGKKALAAMGAVVAAGLTPGIIAATPACMPGQNPNAVITAAEVVAIDGNAYSFEELYAMQQGTNRDANPQVATRYGVMPSQQATHYGVQRPQLPQLPQQPKKTKQEMIALDTIQASLIQYCAQLLEAEGKFTPFSLESDLTRNMGLTEDQLKLLAKEIKRRYGVDVSYRRFYLKDQLNTLRLVSEYILKLKNIWDY
ncbi:MAG: hypothetical protein IKX56_04970 [Muribaculaceae bacterium]|nr:hypothetical protein [Muribaculaceae bacterium]